MENRLHKDDILARLPEMALITDETLREQCVDVMLAAADAGGWNKTNLDLLPVSLTQVKTRHLNKQFDHLRAVTAIALGILDSCAAVYAEIPINRDIVIAGALMHDVGKFVEFIPRNGTVESADNAKLMRHPLSGAIMAARAGLPDALVHIIAVHSFEGKESYETPESAIVKTADKMAFACITLFTTST